MKKIKRTSTNILRLELEDIYDKLDKLVDWANMIEGLDIEVNSLYEAVIDLGSRMELLEKKQ